MIGLFYQIVEDGVARVVSRHHAPHLLREEDKHNYIEVDFIPKAEVIMEKEAVLHVNLKNMSLYYEYEDISTDVSDDRMTQIINKLLNADERYQQLDKFTISLDELKQFKLEQLKYFCSEAIYEGFTSSINDYEFGFNELDQANFTQQTLLIVAAGGNYTAPISWKTKNFGVVELTVSDFNIIINEAAAHKLAQQNKYWELEQEVLNAATPEELDAIEW